MRSLVSMVLLCIVLMGAACKKKEVTAFDINRTDLILLGVSHYTDSIEITSNTNWKLEIPGDASWLQADNIRGFGNGFVRFSITSENNSTPKQTIVKLSAGDIIHWVAIKQLPHYVDAQTFLIGGSQADMITGGVATDDGGFLQVGNSNSTDGDFVGNDQADINGFVSRFNSNGNMEWKRFLGGNGIDQLSAAARTTTGEFIVAGTTSSTDPGFPASQGGFDFWVEKIGSDGVTIWRKRYGGSNSDIAYSVCTTADGNIFVAGSTFSNDKDVANNHGQEDAWVVKLDQHGDIVWTQCHGGISFDNVRKMALTSDGYLVLCGSTKSPEQGSTENPFIDAWVFRIDQAGNKRWSRSFSGLNNNYFLSLITDPDGGIILSAITNGLSFMGVETPYTGGVLAKINDEGSPSWATYLEAPSHRVINSLVLIPDKGYMAAGYGAEAGFLILFSFDGKILWTKYIGGIREDEFSHILLTTGQKIVASGTSRSDDGIFHNNKGGPDAWIHMFE